MTKPGTTRPFALLGGVFFVAGALILILAILNYLQDGKIGLTAAMGIVIIGLGLFWSSRRSSSGPDK
ncbi:MAG TPA: hypothetical protein VNO50_01775 [Pyrinomonadaceae bacterium]|nr:hypothetical protein [Pyrinomonadaceae bacterium]